MSTTILTTLNMTPDAALKRSATLWFLATTAGHWIFLTYILVVFGGTAIQGDFAAWNNRLTRAHVDGDLVGNAVVASHLLFAAIVLGAGLLQLVPHIRSRFPVFHRWVGRFYMGTVVVATLSGLHMLFARDIGSTTLKTGFVAQAALICVFAALAMRFAIFRQFDRHRRWALRFFMVSSIALSYRVIFMIWVLLTGGIGVDFETGEGAFLDVMTIGQFFPLLSLELYFRTVDGGGAKCRYAMAGFLSLAGIATGLGVLLLTVGLWFPLG